MIETRKTLFVSSETWEKLFGKTTEKSSVIEIQAHPGIQADEMFLLSDAPYDFFVYVKKVRPPDGKEGSKEGSVDAPRG